MSRVDDDRQAQRVAERLALQKREQELKQKERVQADSAFSKLVGKGVTEKQAQAQRQQSTAASAIAKLKEELGEAQEESTVVDGEATEVAAKADAHGREAQRSARSKLGEKGSTEKLLRAQDEGQAATTAGRAADEQVRGRADEGQGNARASEGRGADAKKTHESLEEKGAQSAAKGGKALGQKGAIRAEGDSQKGSGGQQNQGGKDDKSQAMPQGFRFNPALMAPVPVAEKRDMAGSDRLRRIANEIAQKIVERVRVGKNQAGAMEFQIDLRSNVLKGLSIKVASQHGKISMVFSGQDQETLKFIEQQADGLKDALGSRGLKLADLKFEATTK